ncbi:MAG: hypothetical protein ABIR06_06710 [Cyclobacteriaceae bacterium]
MALLKMHSHQIFLICISDIKVNWPTVILGILLMSCQTPPELPKGDAANGGIFLPDQFEALVVADSTGRARHLAVNSNGDIYVKLSSTDNKGGGNIALRDTTHDGKADVMINFGGMDSKSTSYGT